MGAYDRFGNLVRAGPNWQRSARKGKEQGTEAEAATEAAKPEDSTESKTLSGQEDLEDLESAVRAGDAAQKEAKQKPKAKDDPGYLPPEMEQDLRPFPLNKHFHSQSVLSEDLREAIYQRVKRDGATVSLASVEFGVTNERVGAVVRLKQMEKEWIAQGKTLALPYSRAVMDMLPQTPYIDTSLPQNAKARAVTHEPINDLMVHPATRQQLFVPVAESRRFTRVDAGKAFANNLLPADERIPHPELVQTEMELAAGIPFRERQKLAEARFDAEEKRRQAAEKRAADELKALKVVPQRRWDFVFKDVSVEDAGRDGKGAKASGWRYGVPHQDRKKGQVKIPTKVEA